MVSEKRTYRFRKRQRSCDSCRRQKLRCRFDAQGSHNTCQRCREDEIYCVFSGRRTSSPRNLPEETRAEDQANSSCSDSRLLHSEIQATTSAQQSADALDNGLAYPSRFASAPIAAENPARASSAADDWTIQSNSLSSMIPVQAPQTQISQSLDKLEGHCYQVFGASSEADPWLLRHCKNDENGFQRSAKVHLRNAGGVPIRGKIPTHFMVYETSICEPAMKETRIKATDRLRSELDDLVSPSQGCRLFRL